MSDVAIRAENLSKLYRISTGKYRHDTIADQLADTFKSLFRRNRGASEERKFWALKDVSFEIRQGEIVGIVGHNGAGKSTLLKLISRITLPTTGRVNLYGRVGSLLEVGTGFHPELSGRENIFLNGAIIGMKKEEIRSRFDEIVDFAGVEKFLETPVKRYSSGMYVRLGFAVAAHLEPEILLVDEVLAVGDASFQRKCLDKIRDSAKGGRSVLFISHNMTAVNSLCNRVIWVNRGRVVKDGPTTETVRDYLATTVNGTNAPEEVWNDMEEAPGNEIVRLRRVGVRRQDGLSDPLTMQTPFQVEVEYWNLLDDARLHITLHVYTAEGVVAFTTSNMNFSPQPKGLFRSVCHVPGNLLNSGTHRFVVLVVKDSASVIHSQECRISCEIFDIRERQGTWYGKEPGVVQPLLKWSMEPVECDEQDRVRFPLHGAKA